MSVILWLLLLCHQVASIETTLEVDDLLKELSWALKLKLLNEMSAKASMTTRTTRTETTPTTTQSQPLITSQKPREVPHVPEAVNTIDIAKSSKVPLPSTFATPVINSPKVEVATPKSVPERRVGVESFVMHRRQSGPEEGIPMEGDGAEHNMKEKEMLHKKAVKDDNDMRIKLFRLMYETVRDSDLKVKRAELIKDHYVNSSAFEIGYLIGDITDKANIITDISSTLKRFHREWKPIEHINAYEQIANQAIEITHLIDLVRVVTKKDNTPHARAVSFSVNK